MFRSSLKRRPSPAMVVAVIALSVALGGTGYAALTLPKNSVRAKQIAPSAVRSAEVKNRSIKRRDLARSVLRAAQGPAGAQGLPGPGGPRGEKGEPGAPGAPGTALAYAWVDSGGTVDETRSKGVTDANVTKSASNVFCFNGLAFTPRNVVATPRESYSDIMVEWPPSGCQFSIVMDPANGFMVLIN